MYCKFCGQQIVEKSACCESCGMKKLEERTKNEELSVKMKKGILYVNPQPQNAWESWYYNKLLK